MPNFPFLLFLFYIVTFSVTANEEIIDQIDADTLQGLTKEAFVVTNDFEDIKSTIERIKSNAESCADSIVDLRLSLSNMTNDERFIREKDLNIIINDFANISSELNAILNANNQGNRLGELDNLQSELEDLETEISELWNYVRTYLNHLKVQNEKWYFTYDSFLAGTNNSLTASATPVQYFPLVGQIFRTTVDSVISSIRIRLPLGTQPSPNKIFISPYAPTLHTNTFVYATSVSTNEAPIYTYFFDSYQTEAYGPYIFGLRATGNNPINVYRCSNGYYDEICSLCVGNITRADPSNMSSYSLTVQYAYDLCFDMEFEPYTNMIISSEGISIENDATLKINNQIVATIPEVNSRIAEKAKIIYLALSNFVFGTSAIANNSITTEKITNNAITSDKIIVNAITSDKIVSNAVTTAKVADNAITENKIAYNAITSDKIVSNSVTTAKVADNAITENKIAYNAITPDKIVSNAVTTVKISDNAITSIKIASNAVTSDKISSNAVKTANLENYAVTSIKLASNAVTDNNILIGTITADKLANETITANKLANGSITSNKLADASITGVKIANNSINGSKIAESSITGDKIQNESITGAKLSNNSVHGDKIVNGTITSDKLSNCVISSNKISSAAISKNHLSNDLVNDLITSDGGIITGQLEVNHMKFSAESDWLIGQPNVCSDIVLQNADAKIRSNAGQLKLAAGQGENISAESFFSFDSGSQAGIAMITNGLKEVDIPCDGITSEAIIMLTPRQLVSNLWWSVQPIPSDSKFKIKIDKEWPINLFFNYLIIRK